MNPRQRDEMVAGEAASTNAPTPSRALERAFLCLLIVLYVATATRAIQMPMVYAVGQWLHDFEFGFVKRGLLGELIQPWLQHKSNAEVFQIVVLVSVVVYTLLSAVLLRAALSIARAGRSDGTIWIRGACGVVLVTSPVVVTAAHLLGYFDHWIALATFAAIAAVARRAWLAAGLIGAVCVFVHELFLLAGLPIVVFAAWLRLEGERAPMRDGLLLVAPIALAGAFIFGSSLLQDPAAVDALQERMRASGIISARWVEMTTYHLSHDLLANLRDQSGKGFERLFDAAVARSVAPSALFMLATGSFLLERVGRRRTIPLFLGAALAPLTLHWIAWDTSRISTLVILQAFVGIFAIGELGLRSQRPSGRASQLPLLLVAGLAIVANTVFSVPLLEAQIDGKGLLEIRSEARPERYVCRQKLFPNSDFEVGSFEDWVATGEAFLEQPVDRDPRGSQRFAGNQGLHWISSAFGSSPSSRQRASGDAPQGAVRSRDFELSGNELVFLVGGGNDPERLYVALVVDGGEVLRATGPGVDAMATIRWNVEAWRGKRAYLIVADLSSDPGGHLSADGFCYAR